MKTGKLFVAATPIGNLKDISQRALEALKEADLVLSEDTRVAGNLLAHYKISKPLLSYHQHSDVHKIDKITSMVAGGKNIVLVTDAGTPGISDPGNFLIGDLSRRLPDVLIIPIPGPSALTAALSVCGFPSDNFLFLGFPPHKNKRQRFFKEVAEAARTVVFYESGHRILKCLRELKEVLDPDSRVVVCRELTKKFETIYRGTIAEIIAKMNDERGEFVIVINQKSNVKM